MKIPDQPREVVCSCIVKHLHVVHGIKLKNYRRKKERQVTAGTKVFGVPLESLRQCCVSDGGQLPCFLVDACEYLLQHAGTDGLFRKSGSVVRLKNLQAKLDKGETCLATALPCDVASLLKLFCRELRDPLVPSELQSVLLKAQLLPSVQERTSAALLVSCLLPDRNTAFLRYFFNFLSKVSSRSSENQMTSSNLAVIFAPSLLPFSQRAEGVDTSLKLKAAKAVVHTYIENAPLFGVVPVLIMEAVPGFPMTPVVTNQGPTSSYEPGDVEVSPCTRPIRKRMGMEAFPVTQLFRSNTFCSAPNTGQPCSSPPAMLTRFPPSPLIRESNKTRSQTLKRNESGNVGCFSARKLKSSDVRGSPSLYGLVKLKLTPWKNRRRTTL
ncbi:hypothetical protein DPEC_G00116340 [Dallia pectoralis]|uniref:Uncharacterized protein n=1 Tax=Dallia pectoralis TaxID=75939 RepID=A0ACC2GUM9_DALPE|nr:hypothetical protein DPEC_G00116340 [Dallia pectoralis]